MILEAVGVKKHFPVSGGFASRGAGMGQGVDGVVSGVRGRDAGDRGESGPARPRSPRCFRLGVRPPFAALRRHGDRRVRSRRSRRYRARCRRSSRIPYSSLTRGCASRTSSPSAPAQELVERGHRARACGGGAGAVVSTRSAALYPHEFASASASASRSPGAGQYPKLIVLDEPVSRWTSRPRPDSHLSRIWQAAPARLHRDLSRPCGARYLSTSLRDVRGHARETGPCNAVYTAAPSYTRRCSPGLTAATGARRQRIVLSGEVPTHESAAGCAFTRAAPNAALPHGRARLARGQAPHLPPPPY